MFGIGSSTQSHQFPYSNRPLGSVFPASIFATLAAARLSVEDEKAPPLVAQSWRRH
jgi:hypothetical protein